MAKPKVGQRTVHAGDRCVERFDTVLNTQFHHDVCRLIQKGKADPLDPPCSGPRRFVVACNGRRMIVVYDHASKRLVTLYPVADEARVAALAQAERERSARRKAAAKAERDAKRAAASAGDGSGGDAAGAHGTTAKATKAKRRPHGVLTPLPASARNRVPRVPSS